MTEGTPTKPINPYGKAKLASEQVLRDYAASDHKLQGLILRYFNVFGSDPEGLLGEYPPPSLRQHARISGACMEAALHEDVKLTITGVHRVLKANRPKTTLIYHTVPSPSSSPYASPNC